MSKMVLGDRYFLILRSFIDIDFGMKGVWTYISKVNLHRNFGSPNCQNLELPGGPRIFLSFKM